MRYILLAPALAVLMVTGIAFADIDWKANYEAVLVELNKVNAQLVNATSQITLLTDQNEKLQNATKIQQGIIDQIQNQHAVYNNQIKNLEAEKQFLSNTVDRLKDDKQDKNKKINTMAKQIKELKQKMKGMEPINQTAKQIELNEAEVTAALAKWNEEYSEWSKGRPNHVYWEWDSYFHNPGLNNSHLVQMGVLKAELSLSGNGFSATLPVNDTQHEPIIYYWDGYNKTSYDLIHSSNATHIEITSAVSCGKRALSQNTVILSEGISFTGASGGPYRLILVPDGNWGDVARTGLISVGGMYPGELRPDTYVWEAVKVIPNTPSNMHNSTGHIQTEDNIIDIIRNGTSNVWKPVGYSGTLIIHEPTEWIDKCQAILDSRLPGVLGMPLSGN